MEVYMQNLDGGFGKGLDPDNWNINSVPYACIRFYTIKKELFLLWK